MNTYVCIYISVYPSHAGVWAVWSFFFASDSDGEREREREREMG